MLLDDRLIRLWSYNLETILAEKLQTVLARGVLNTRMRDFYDIRTLLSIYEEEIDENVLKAAFEATCKKRETENLKAEGTQIITAIEEDVQLHNLWKSYEKNIRMRLISATRILWKVRNICFIKFNNM